MIDKKFINPYMTFISKVIVYFRTYGIMMSIKKVFRIASGLFSSRDNGEIDMPELSPYLKYFDDGNPRLHAFSPVDIVIPVYNAYEYLVDLADDLYNNTSVPFRIIAINDRSTDERILPFLRNLAQTKDNFVFLENKTNLGFVKTVNLGLSYSDRNVVILNTDVKVPPGWLERLMFPIETIDGIASVTPMSNSSTITSFPDLMKSNDLFEGLTVNQIDSVFGRISCDPEIYVDTPTGHGFCMAMSRKVLNDVGYFDADSFGRGNGEENDWCLRAMSGGYRNIIAPNLFLYHRHSGSFSSEEKRILCARNSVIVRKRYPRYHELVKKTISNRSYLDLRSLVFFVLCAETADNVIVRFEHALGGGSHFALVDYAKEMSKGDMLVVVKPETTSSGGFIVSFSYGEYSGEGRIDVCRDLFIMLELLNADSVIVNQLAGYSDVKMMLSGLTDYVKTKSIGLQINVRDFYPACPSVRLIDSRNRFCNLDYDGEDCLRCFDQIYRVSADGLNLSEWRKMWGDFLSLADQIHVFSNFTKNTLMKVFVDTSVSEKIRVDTIPVEYLRPVTIDRETGKIRIAVMGHMSHHKGGGIIHLMAKLIVSNPVYLGVSILVFGSLKPEYRHPGIVEMGEYKREDISELMEKHRIDIIFIPSIWGETFSRTTQEAIEMKMPVAVFNIGAPPERVSVYDKGIVIEEMSALAALDSIVSYFDR